MTDNAANPPICGMSEIAVGLGISRQRADQLSHYKGFPEPIAHLRAGRIWLEDDVRAWADKKERTWHEAE